MVHLVWIAVNVEIWTCFNQSLLFVRGRQSFRHNDISRVDPVCNLRLILTLFYCWRLSISSETIIAVTVTLVWRISMVVNRFYCLLFLFWATSTPVLCGFQQQRQIRGVIIYVIWTFSSWIVGSLLDRLLTIERL